MAVEIAHVSGTLTELLAKIRELSGRDFGDKRRDRGILGTRNIHGKGSRRNGENPCAARPISRPRRGDVAREMRNDAQTMLHSCDALLERAATVSELGRGEHKTDGSSQGESFWNIRRIAL